ncbi:MAG TPA: ABC transporter substrate-binding protein [Actinomycetota bacterium]
MNPRSVRTPSYPRPRHRTFLLVAIAGLAIISAACSDSAAPLADGGGAGSASEGPWTFTDDRPVTVTHDAVPQRIIAYEEDAATLMELGIRPIAIFGSGPLEDNVFLEGQDLTGIESVGEVWGEIDIEKVASLAPDLIVNSYWASTQSGGGWGFATKKQLETLEAIAPVVQFESGTSAIGTTKRYLELAQALGADIEAPEVASQRQAYDDAVARLEAAVEANPGISVLAVAAIPSDQVYIADPSTFPDLVDLATSGVELMAPDTIDDGAWEYLSWEEATKYQPDLLMVDRRPSAPTFQDLLKVPTWTKLRAVEAGQLIPWKVPSVESFQLQADRIDALAEAIEGARDLDGSE